MAIQGDVIRINKCSYHFSIINASSVWTLSEKFILVFFDDIFVYNISLEEHLGHLQVVLELLRSHQLFAKRTKFDLSQSQIKYLRHIISGDRVSTDPNKITAMVNWPQQFNNKELRGFLGLTGYYRRFIKEYAVLSKPLTTLLKKGAFQWSVQRPFMLLKTL